MQAPRWNPFTRWFILAASIIAFSAAVYLVRAFSHHVTLLTLMKQAFHWIGA